MSKVLKLLLPGLVIVNGLCTSTAVDESLKKVDTIPKWALTVARSTITVFISACTLFTALKLYDIGSTTKEPKEVDDTDDEDEEIEFEDDLD